MIGKLLYFFPFILSYLVVDRLLSRYYTGSWWGQPSDVADEKEETNP